MNAAACLWAAEQGAGAHRWQNVREMRSPASDSGNMLARCVPGRQSVAIFALHASPKGPRTGKEALRGNISPPCIQNELALARYARHVSEKPRKPLLEDASREHLAREGPFSLHGPLESCTARESCHPSSNSASDRKHGAALMAWQPAYGRQNRARAASCRAGWRCRRSAWRCGVPSASGKAGISEAPLADPRHQQLHRISRASIRGESSGRGGGKEAPIKRPHRARAARCLCKRLFRLRTGYAANF